jgi:hypothetical protein
VRNEKDKSVMKFVNFLSLLLYDWGKKYVRILEEKLLKYKIKKQTAR